MGVGAKPVFLILILGAIWVQRGATECMKWGQQSHQSAARSQLVSWELSAHIDPKLWTAGRVLIF